MSELRVIKEGEKYRISADTDFDITVKNGECIISNYGSCFIMERGSLDDVTANEADRRSIWLERVGTISLDADFMRQNIKFGGIFHDVRTGKMWIDSELDPSNLAASIWLACVPEAFSKRAGEVFLEEAQSYHMDKIEHDTVEKIIMRFQSVAERDFRDGRLTREGWE